MDSAIRVAPAKINRNRCRPGEFSQSEMQFGAALTGMSVAHVNLGDHQLAVRQLNGGGCADGLAAADLGGWMSEKNSGGRCRRLVHRQQQIKLEDAARCFGLIVVEGRIFPLVGDGKIQQSISIYVRSGNSARYLG